LVGVITKKEALIVAQSEQNKRIIMVVVIAVCLGVLYFFYQQVYPDIQRIQQDIVEQENERAMFGSTNLELLASNRDRMSQDYLKLIGGAIAIVIAAFFVIRYLSSTERKSNKDGDDS
jgi:hypothetical protein